MGLPRFELGSRTFSVAYANQPTQKDGWVEKGERSTPYALARITAPTWPQG